MPGYVGVRFVQGTLTAVLAWEVPLALVGLPYEVGSLTKTSAPFLLDTSKDNSRLKLCLPLCHSLPMALRGGYTWPGDLTTQVSLD